jgi:hypothetical protein
LLAGCNDSLDDESVAGEGGVAATVFVPDYIPQEGAIYSVTAQLSLKNSAGTFTVYGEPVTLDMETITSDLPDLPVPDDLPGGYCAISFEHLKTGVYAVGDMRVELLDAEGEVFFEGFNKKAVVIRQSLKKSSVVLHAAAKNPVDDSGSIEPGKLRFWKVDLTANVPYTLTLSAEDAYPDLLFYLSDGSFYFHQSIDSAEQATLPFSPTENVSYYIGIWANNGAVSSYTLVLST